MQAQRVTAQQFAGGPAVSALVCRVNAAGVCKWRAGWLAFGGEEMPLRAACGPCECASTRAFFRHQSYMVTAHTSLPLLSPPLTTPSIGFIRSHHGSPSCLSCRRPRRLARKPHWHHLRSSPWCCCPSCELRSPFARLARRREQPAAPSQPLQLPELAQHHPRRRAPRAEAERSFGLSYQHSAH